MTERTVTTTKDRARVLVALAVVTLLAPDTRVARAEGPTRPASRPGDSRVEALIQKMTLEEKLGQLSQQWGGENQDADPVVRKKKQEELNALIREGKVGSLLGAHGAEYTNGLQRIAVEESRLGIPLILGNDVIHGYRTIFPIPLGEASTWDPELIARASRVAAIEAAAAGTHWTFAPMVDVCRDPRWGRIAEGAGEDPYLGAAMAAARVRGFQGDDLAAPETILACAKHYVAYGGAEGGRDYNTVDLSEQTLREVYLPPFQAAVNAGVRTIMSAFNEISGVPCSGNRHTLTDILREEWGFDGFVVSDWGAVDELTTHGIASDDARAAEQAIVAGVDMDMCSLFYRTHLGESVRRGAVSEEIIDQAVRRVLRAKFEIGLFDRPYVDPQREKVVILSEAHRTLAREVARRSIVLLKNEGRLLPLDDGIGAIAVIGPLADNRWDPLGTWSAVGKPEDVVTVLEGIRSRLGADAEVHYAKGCEILGGGTDGFAEALQAARKSDVAILVVGESEAMSGEGRCRSSLDLPDGQRQLVQAVHATGVPTVVVLMNGRPLSIGWTAENVPAILETWHLGVECGHAIADVLFGDFNPGGKLPVTVPRTVGQVPIYYAHKNTGRPPTSKRYTSKYIDVPWTPLFPFGYGLSYTQFEYGILRVTPAKIGPYGQVAVRVEVKNTGDRAGDEVVQLYIRDLVGSLTRPVKQLRGFRRVTLQPGETTTVSFTLSREHLGFYDRHLEYVVEPGVFQVWAGPNSTEGPSAEFEVVKE
jgi:beta-glucosidase